MKREESSLPWKDSFMNEKNSSVRDVNLHVDRTCILPSYLNSGSG